jgi:general secretion pathway protein G
MENSEERTAKSERRSRFPHPSPARSYRSVADGSLISRRQADPPPGGPHPSSCSPGFTLLELLAVFVIIVTLAGMILGVTKYAATNAATSRARAEIATMETALESFKNDNGAYPLSTVNRDSGYGSSPGPNEKSNSHILYGYLSGTIPPGSKQYFKFKLNQLREDPPNSGYYYIVDPFGNPYNYYCNPGALDQTNQPTFDLWSYGPNGLNDEGSGDDISNWRR